SPLSIIHDTRFKEEFSSRIVSYRSLQLEAGPVIKLDIVNRLADETGIPKLKAEQAVDALFHSMKEALARGERIELRGFGVFIVKPRKRGVGRNPRTGQEVAIPSGKTIRFKPGKELQAHGFSVGHDHDDHDAHESRSSSGQSSAHDNDTGF